jgi:putative transposase
VVELRFRPTLGRVPKLADAEKDQLQEILPKGAKAGGFPSELWACPRVARVIARHFGVRYHVDHIGRLLHGLGWTLPKPQRLAVERDEGAIRNWIRRD